MPTKKSVFGISLCFLFIISGCRTTDLSEKHHPASVVPIQPSGTVTGFIDCHNHLFAGKTKDFSAAARAAVKNMDALGISKMILMPPPGSPGHPGIGDMKQLTVARRLYPERFFILGGGGSLNLYIHRTEPAAVSSRIKKQFTKKAMALLENQAAGFGEFAVEHFSFSPTHPYESVPPDHPLLLLLADIAARYRVPVDIHMEAVTHDMAFPTSRFLHRSPHNPAELKENINAFERLLSHNRKAKIIWAHAGWCSTGHRTAKLCRQLLKKHPNLYMSFKLSPEGVPANRLLTSDRSEIKTPWLALIREFPDRFILGTDQFYGPPGSRRIGPQKTEAMITFFNLLPPDLAKTIGIKNPMLLFGL